MTIEKVQEIIQDKQVDAQEAKDLNDIIRTNVIDSKLSETINKNITPDLIKGILSGIENATKNQNSIDPVYMDLLKGLRMYLGENDSIKNRIHQLETKITNLPNIEKRKTLENNIKEPLDAMVDLNSKLLTAYFIVDVATTSETQQVTLDAINQLFSSSISTFKDIQSFLDGKKQEISVFQKNILSASKEFKDFDKKNPLLVTETLPSGSVSGLRNFIVHQLTTIDTNSVFNSSLKGIKSNRLKDFLTFQQQTIKTLPDNQVMPYIKSLEVKVGELKNNKNLTSDDVASLESIFTGVFKNINSYMNQNNIEVPQISQQEYLSKMYDDGLFSQAEYKQAFEKSFDEENSVLGDNAVQYTTLSISKAFDKPTFDQIKFVPHFVTIGKEIDSLLDNDPELSKYPIGTRVLVVVPMDKDKITDELKFMYKDNKFVKTTEGEMRTHRTYIIFGENTVFDELKGNKFADSYQRIGDKDMLNGNEFPVIADGKINFNQFDNRGEKAFSTWLSNQPNDVLGELPGLENILQELIGNGEKSSGYQNKTDILKTTEYKKGFQTALISEVLKRAPKDNLLLQKYLDLVGGEKGLQLHRLGVDFPAQKENFKLIQNFITTNKWAESSDGAQKKIATIVGSLGLVFQSQEVPKTFQNTIESYAKVLLSSPLGKMFLSLIDSFFGGKGGFLDKIAKWDKSGKLAESVNKQFKEKYELSGDQFGVIKGLSGDDNKTFDKITPQEKPTFTKHEELAKILKDKGNLLDANVLKSFVKNGELVLDDKKHAIGTVFTINEKGEYTVKENIDPTVLTSILKQKSIEKSILDTDILLKTQDKDKYYGKAEEKRGIKTEADYAAFLTAYLMGGSKGDAKFHYVIAENNIGSTWTKEATPPENKDVSDKQIIESKFKQDKDKLFTDISAVKDKDAYKNISISKYAFDAKGNDYQKDILEPLKKLFTRKTFAGDGNDGKLGYNDNFELFGNSLASPNETIDWNIHLKNLFIYLNQGKQKDKLYSDDVIENIGSMKTIRKLDKDLVLESEDKKSNIKLSFVFKEGKTKEENTFDFNAKYEKASVA